MKKPIHQSLHLFLLGVDLSNNRISVGAIIFSVVLSFFLYRCSPGTRANENENENIDKHTSIKQLFKSYYEERLKLFPLEATQNGDNQYNDQLPNEITLEFQQEEKRFYQKYLDSLKTYDSSKLNANDQISYDVLKWDLEMSLDGVNYPDELMPVNQFWSLTLAMGQLGSGTGIQPFKTVMDYEDWLGRVNGFDRWTDTAISNMRKGAQRGIVLPKILATRVIPQLQSMITADAKQSIFYDPVENFPPDFSDADRQRLTEIYVKAIKEQIIPSYQKLLDFFQNEYLPATRTSSGISAIPGGTDYYNYLIRYWTTTNMSADEIFNLGQNEVKRLRSEMENVMNQTGFEGDLKEFFDYIHTDKKFFPFKTAEEVLNAYRTIEDKQKPYLNKLFTVFPKTPFEIRRTEAFREASASAEYQQGSADGTRPGIFYVPIPNPSKFSNISMEDLFLHEAIPGHHYQISVQQENKDLPEFRRFIWYGAYGEGWALYCESLGKELGLYQDPYQYFGMLSSEMHRAIRLVVDVGLHTKGWTREQAIKFSMENEADSEAEITSEIERYMAIPDQALSYKIGQLKILELRKNAEQQLGNNFSLAKFHDEILKDGCLPIAVLESKMNKWIEEQKKSL